MTDVVTVRLRPTPYGRLYVDVIVHPTLAALRARIRQASVRDVRRLARTYGWCAWFTFTDRATGEVVRHPLVAEVHLAATQLTSGIVAHEMYHAALYWARRVGVRLSDLAEVPRGAGPTSAGRYDSAEERVARALQRLVYEFTRRMRAMGHDVR